MTFEQIVNKSPDGYPARENGPCYCCKVSLYVRFLNDLCPPRIRPLLAPKKPVVPTILNWSADEKVKEPREAEGKRSIQKPFIDSSAEPWKISRRNQIGRP